LSTLLNMKRAGFQVLLVLMDPKTPFVNLQHRAQHIGVRAVHMWKESDLDVWR